MVQWEHLGQRRSRPCISSFRWSYRLLASCKRHMSTFNINFLVAEPSIEYGNEFFLSKTINNVVSKVPWIFWEKGSSWLDPHDAIWSARCSPPARDGSVDHSSDLSRDWTTLNPTISRGYNFSHWLRKNLRSADDIYVNDQMKDWFIDPQLGFKMQWPVVAGSGLLIWQFD